MNKKRTKMTRQQVTILASMRVGTSYAPSGASFVVVHFERENGKAETFAMTADGAEILSTLLARQAAATREEGGAIAGGARLAHDDEPGAPPYPGTPMESN